MKSESRHDAIIVIATTSGVNSGDNVDIMMIPGFQCKSTPRLNHP